MTPITMNALLTGVLLTACFSVFAEESSMQSSFSTEGTGSSSYSTLSAPADEQLDAASAQGGEVEGLVRSSADSMHSRDIADTQVPDDYKVNTLGNTGE